MLGPFDSPGPGNFPLANVAAKVAEKSAIASFESTGDTLGDSSIVSIRFERRGALTEGGCSDSKIHCNRFLPKTANFSS